MHGNVNEWGRDRITPLNNNAGDGGMPYLQGGVDQLLTGGVEAVARGGSWHEYLEGLRSGNRYYASHSPDDRSRDLGLRVAIVFDPVIKP